MPASQVRLTVFAVNNFEKVVMSNRVPAAAGNSQPACDMELARAMSRAEAAEAVVAAILSHCRKHAEHAELHCPDLGMPPVALVTVADIMAIADGSDEWGLRGCGPFAFASPAEVRAALPPEEVPAFDEAWQELLARAGESFCMPQPAMLDHWRRMAWLFTHDPAAYRHSQEVARKVLAGEDVPATPHETVMRELGLWPRPAEHLSLRGEADE